MSIIYPDTHKTKKDRLIENTRAFTPQIVRNKPSRNEGNDGDIAFGNTKNGIRLYLKLSNKWHTFSPDKEPINIYSPTSYASNRTITGSTSAADTTDVLATLINDLINIGILSKPNKRK
jgi:hypothetical protein